LSIRCENYQKGCKKQHKEAKHQKETVVNKMRKLSIRMQRQHDKHDALHDAKATKKMQKL
jgi:hypothetical protein